jgi:hypothetical protein
MRKKRRLLELGDGPRHGCGSARTQEELALSDTAASAGCHTMLTSARVNRATLVTPTVQRLAAKLTHDHQQAIGSERYGDPARRHERSL